MMYLCDDHEILGQQPSTLQRSKGLGNQVLIVGRSEKNEIEGARSPPQFVDHGNRIAFEDPCLAQKTQGFKVPPDDAAGAARSIDKRARSRATREGFQSHAPCSAKQIQKVGIRNEIVQDAEEGASDEIPHRTDATLVPFDEFPASSTASDDAHGAPLRLRIHVAMIADETANTQRIRISIREGGSVIQPFDHRLEVIGFDLDWTLCHYPLSTQQVLEQSLDRAGLDPLLLGNPSDAAEQYNTLWRDWEFGKKSSVVLRDLILKHMLAGRGIEDSAVLHALAEAYTDVRRESGVLLYPGVLELLDALCLHYRLGMITNGPLDMQTEKLEVLGIGDRFDLILIAGELGVYKPDARIFDRFVQGLDVRAERVLFVGDSYEADVLGAHAAGMYTAWINHHDVRAPGDVMPTLVKTETASLDVDLL